MLEPGRPDLFRDLALDIKCQAQSVTSQGEKTHTCLRQYLFFHHHVPAVIEFSFVPEGAVRQVMLASR